MIRNNLVGFILLISKVIKAQQISLPIYRLNDLAAWNNMRLESIYENHIAITLKQMFYIYDYVQFNPIFYIYT